MKRAFLVLLLPLGGVTYTTPASSEALSQYCQNVYVEYSNAPGPKAFVTGGDGSCWWWHGTKTLAQSQKNALNACTKSGAQNCKLRESEL